MINLLCDPIYDLPNWVSEIYGRESQLASAFVNLDIILPVTLVDKSIAKIEDRHLVKRLSLLGEKTSLFFQLAQSHSK